MIVACCAGWGSSLHTFNLNKHGTEEQNTIDGHLSTAVFIMMTVWCFCSCPFIQIEKDTQEGAEGTPDTRIQRTEDVRKVAATFSRVARVSGPPTAPHLSWIWSLYLCYASLSLNPHRPKGWSGL